MGVWGDCVIELITVLTSALTSFSSPATSADPNNGSQRMVSAEFSMALCHGCNCPPSLGVLFPFILNRNELACSRPLLIQFRVRSSPRVVMS
ncbi:hypothetical protein QBC37DRAFT_190437 [Rhypophila decipiens]|uniref:Secreted protein n=1 Tax=Rhypophila decipiens TaxID=261697 RepID=A0AAN6YG11_9PEZI|nr:hypothetical protein QBC37DRAFT_190437 [Rhypophila decipiens]